MTNIALFAEGGKPPPVCAEHGPTCERIVEMEVTVRDVKDKVRDIDRKQDRFFWALLIGLAGIVMTLLIALINMSMNERMLTILKTAAH